MARSSSLVLGLTGLLLLVTPAGAALVDPPRRVRLGTCSAAPCAWCDGSEDAVCPAAGVEVVPDCEVDVFSSDSMCTQECADPTSGCTSDTICDLAVTGSVVSANLITTVDEAPCAGSPGAVAKIELSGTRGAGAPFSVAATLDCCSTNVACQPVGASCSRPALQPNPFLCDRQCPPGSACFVSEANVPPQDWMTHQLFPAAMVPAVQAVLSGGGLPVITSATSPDIMDHSSDAQPTVAQYGVTVSFITPPPGFNPLEFDTACSVTAVCGNGAIEPGEECDDGAANGTSASCCDPSCTFTKAGTPCDGGFCDGQGRCGATTTTTTGNPTTTTSSTSTSTSTTTPTSTSTTIGTSTTTTLGNAPPDCTAATASPAALWPPDRRFVPVSVAGVTDPNGDPVTITVTGLRQDEVVERDHDDTCPDGSGIGTPTAVLRAERAPRADGRVYHVDFTADDGRGGRCGSTVFVCVPRARGQACADGGPLFDSTGPCSEQ